MIVYLQLSSEPTSKPPKGATKMVKRYPKTEIPSYYFAYGSNLFTPQMLARCPESIPVAAAKIKGFRLAYSRKTGKGTGALDILPDPGRVVHGAVYQISNGDLARLDKCEGRGFAYERVSMLVTLATGETIYAWVYRVITPEATDCAPSQDYMTKVALGMKEWALPYWYRTAFELWSKGLMFTSKNGVLL